MKVGTAGGFGRTVWGSFFCLKALALEACFAFKGLTSALVGAEML